MSTVLTQPTLSKPTPYVVKATREIARRPTRIAAPDAERAITEAIVDAAIDLWNLGQTANATAIILDAAELAFRTRWCHFGSKTHTTKSGLGCVLAMRAAGFIDRSTCREAVKILKESAVDGDVVATVFATLVRLARSAANVEFEVRMAGGNPARQPTPTEIASQAAELKAARMAKRQTPPDLRAEQADCLKAYDEADDEAEADSWSGKILA